jgi:hypothetical protein
VVVGSKSIKRGSEYGIAVVIPELWGALVTIETLVTFRMQLQFAGVQGRLVQGERIEQMHFECQCVDCKSQIEQ